MRASSALCTSDSFGCSSTAEAQRMEEADGDESLEHLSNLTSHRDCQFSSPRPSTQYRLVELQVPVREVACPQAAVSHRTQRHSPSRLPTYWTVKHQYVADPSTCEGGSITSRAHIYGTLPISDRKVLRPALYGVRLASCSLHACCLVVRLRLAAERYRLANTRQASPPQRFESLSGQTRSAPPQLCNWSLMSGERAN